MSQDPSNSQTAERIEDIQNAISVEGGLYEAIVHGITLPTGDEELDDLLRQATHHARALATLQLKVEEHLQDLGLPVFDY